MQEVFLNGVFILIFLGMLYIVFKDKFKLDEKLKGFLDRFRD